MFLIEEKEGGKTKKNWKKMRTIKKFTRENEKIFNLTHKGQVI